MTCILTFQHTGTLFYSFKYRLWLRAWTETELTACYCLGDLQPRDSVSLGLNLLIYKIQKMVIPVSYVNTFWGDFLMVQWLRLHASTAEAQV